MNKRTAVEVINPPEDETPADEPAAEAEAPAPEDTDPVVEGDPDAEPQGEQPPAAEEEFSVSLGDDPPAAEEDTRAAPDWVRDLRKQHRELARRNRELEEQLKQTAPAAAKPKLGAKPTLEGCDYDAEVYERELAQWFEAKRAADAEARQIEEQQQSAARTWQEKLAAYGAAKTSLKVPDYDDAEALVQEQFNVTQQGILLQGLENPAMVVYALGKNPKRAKELSAITDPVAFAVAAGKLEAQLKVVNRKAPPPPVKPLQSSGPVSGTVDSNLERLRAEAERTGDYTKVFQYKRQQQAKRK